MRFWWVNHGQTFKVEIEEECIWSPQKEKNGVRSQAYDNLTRTSIGDIIFSYADGEIKAVGKVTEPAVAQEQPKAFGPKGYLWDKAGWWVGVLWYKLLVPFIPKGYMAEIAPLLADKYAPLRKNGYGNQKMYLSEISELLANKLQSLIDEHNFEYLNELEDIFDARIEDATADKIIHSAIPPTQKKQLIDARIGQGLFRQNVEKIESHCRVTGLKDIRLLIASHIKPWKDSTDIERLDGHNGFLLSPHIDRLFDKGWISFKDNGTLLISTRKILPVLKIWHIEPNKLVGTFTSRQMEFLQYHRDKIFNG